MHTLPKISVGIKILVLVFLPLSGLVFFSGKQILRDVSAVREVKELELFRQKAGQMAQRLLSERIDTVIYLDNHNASGKTLENHYQMARADEDDLNTFLNDFKGKTLGPDFDQQLKHYREQLSALQVIRQKVLARTADKAESMAVYKTIINLPGDMVNSAAKIIKDYEIARTTRCYAALMHANSCSTNINQAMMDIILMNGLAPDQLRDLCILVGEQANFERNFLGEAPDAIRQSYLAITEMPSSKQIAEHINTAIEKAQQGPVEASTWAASIEDLSWSALIKEKRALTYQVQADLGKTLDAQGKKLEHKVRIESVALMGYLAVVCLLALTIRSYLVRSIKTCLGFNNQIAQGDLSTQLVFTQQDEIGSLMGNMNRMVGKLTGMIGNIMGKAREVNLLATKVSDSSADMRKQLDVFFEGTKTVKESVDRLNGQSDGLTQLEGSLPKLFSLTENVKLNIETVERAASEMSHEIQRSSEATRQMTTQSSSLAGATEEMSASLEEIRRSTEQASDITNEVVNCTARGISEVSELDHLTHQVEEVTRVVASLAAQTHLLALNASIEAANAGKAGVGFAVVAEEVKVLAEKSRQAAERINERIVGMRQKSGETLAVISQMGALIEQLNGSNQMIASAVAQQSIAMKEISAGVEGFANSADQINSNLELAASNAEKVATQVEEATPGVALIVAGVQFVQVQTQQIHKTMEENGVRMVACAKEVDQTQRDAHNLSGIANQLKESVTIFKIQVPA